MSPSFTQLRGWLWCGALWALCISAVVPTGRAESPAADDLVRCVRELGSSDFATRQRAERDLEAAGAGAVPFIAAAARSSDAEVCGRAIRILLSHAMSSQAERREPARAALESAAAANDRAGRAAKAALVKVREVTASLAVAELMRLGARVAPVDNTVPLKYEVHLMQSWGGGDAHVAKLLDLGDVRTVNMDNAPVSDACLVHIGKLTTLSKLWMGNSRLTGSELQQLAPLTQLEILSLKDLPIDDARLATLPKLPNLQQLTLDGTRITSAGLAHLGQYSLLHTLNLERTAITDAGLAHLKPLSNLRKLHLGSTQTGDAGLAELAQVPGLTTLSLRGVQLRPDSLKHLTELGQLEWLSLEETNITDEQLADLAGLPRLRSLWLTRTGITDQGIGPLKALKDLEDIHLQASQVTADGVEELRRALPNCRVEK